MGEEMKGTILHYQSLGPANLPKEAFHLARQLLAHGNWRLKKKEDVVEIANASFGPMSLSHMETHCFSVAIFSPGHLLASRFFSHN